MREKRGEPKEEQIEKRKQSHAKNTTECMHDCRNKKQYRTLTAAVAATAVLAAALLAPPPPDLFRLAAFEAFEAFEAAVAAAEAEAAAAAAEAATAAAAAAVLFWLLLLPPLRLRLACGRARTLDFPNRKVRNRKGRFQRRGEKTEKRERQLPRETERWDEILKCDQKDMASHERK